MDTLKQGDKARVLRNSPCSAPLNRGDIVTVMALRGNDRITVADAEGETWFVGTSDVELIPEEKPEAPTADSVVRPHHYARYVIEPITFIMANKLPYSVGNVIKYVCRFDAKNGREDIRKAIRYCEMILEQMDREEAGTVADAANRPL